MAKYKVTGKYAYTDRQFKAIHTNNYQHAMGINLWKGTVWKWFEDTQRWEKIKVVGY